jgi:hypothetical protein
VKAFDHIIYYIHNLVPNPVVYPVDKPVEEPVSEAVVEPYIVKKGCFLSKGYVHLPMTNNQVYDTQSLAGYS